MILEAIGKTLIKLAFKSFSRPTPNIEDKAIL